MATLVELKARAKKMGYKGYSKMKKAEIEKLLTTPPPKPPRTKPVSQRVPVRQVQPAKKAKGKEPTSISGKNILVRSKFETAVVANRSNRELGLKASELKKGTMKNFSADDTYKDMRFLYFVKNLPDTPLVRKKGYFVEGGFGKAAMQYGDYFNPLEEDTKFTKTRKLSDAEIKSIARNSPRMMKYLHTPDLFKKSYPFLGVYETEMEGRDSTYGILYADVELQKNKYEYKLVAVGKFARNMKFNAKFQYPNS